MSRGLIAVVVINDETVIRGYRPDAILGALGRERWIGCSLRRGTLSPSRRTR